jgi:polysaccharide biosynthesis protein PslG
LKTRNPRRGATRGASRSAPPARPPDRPRSPGQPIFGLLLARRRLLVALILGLVLIVAGVALRGTIRHDAADFLGVRLKNQVLALWTIAVAPPLDTADLAPIAHDDVPPFAVNVFLDQEVQLANVDRSLDLVRALGFHFIKQELVWSDVERPSKGQFVDSAVVGKSSWDNYDRIVEEAQKRGIEVIFRIDTSPAWARPGTDKIETPPQNYQDYADFVATVVQRYRGRVHYYQVWNEPNWAFEWGDHVASPSEYVILLKMAYTSAKAVDPNVTILSASLAPTIENSDRAESDVTFLQEMYDAGAKPYFDVLSANAYGLRNGPDDWRFNRTDDVNFARPVLLRETMVRNGDQGKPIWASEIGWDALPADWSQYPLLFGSVSRALQAEYTVRAYQRAAEQWPWMDVMAVWHLRKVHPADAAVQDYYFDLVSTDWQLEPVYLALQQLAAAPPVVHRGYHQESYWGLSWGPGWQHVTDPRAVLGGYQQTSAAGAQLDFDLDASWLDLVTTVGPGRGTVSVTVDGSPLKANRLPIEGGQAILNLTGPAERWQVRQPIADALGPGVHHVTLRVLRGDVAIDGLVADRESPRDQLYWQLSGGLLGLALLVAAWRSHGHSTEKGME